MLPRCVLIRGMYRISCWKETVESCTKKGWDGLVSVSFTSFPTLLTGSSLQICVTGHLTLTLFRTPSVRLKVQRCFGLKLRRKKKQEVKDWAFRLSFAVFCSRENRKDFG